MSATADLVRASLWVTPTEGRLQALARAAGAADVEWDHLVSSLEMHGVLALVARNLALAGAVWPESVRSSLEERLRALAHDAWCTRRTLHQLLTAARAGGVAPILLKGSSLAVDLYSRDDLRAQGDIDVLLPASRIGSAIDAAAPAGLFLGERDYPVWWYRLSHFHLTLRPATALGREVELHWGLHSPALLLTDDIRRIIARAAPVRAGGLEALVLDPLDRYLHLATHLLSHAHGELPARLMEVLLAEPEPPVRLKWLLDLAAETDRLCLVAAASDLAIRAREWNAEADLAAVIDLLVDEGLLDAPEARSWAGDVRGKILAGARVGREAPGATGLKSGHPPGALGFRLGSLRRLPKWIWPPLDFVRRRHGLSVGIPGSFLAFGLRFGHALAVISRVVLAAILFPAALVGRALLARGRLAARRAALTPDAVLDLVANLRSQESAPR